MTIPSWIIDPGHGGIDPGALAFGVRERDWNLAISLYEYKRLKELGVSVGITRTTDVTLDSGPRTKLIRDKYAYCISNHWNAFNGTARGIEVIHSIHGGKREADLFANELAKATGIPLRRTFSKMNEEGDDWYFMHRLTGNTKTFIIEHGFLDNKEDFNWYNNEANMKKAAEAVIKTICIISAVAYRPPGEDVPKPVPPRPVDGNTLYKVQAGAFKDIRNAEALHEHIESLGVDAFVVNDGGFFKVQAGAYSIRENAEKQLERVSKIVKNAFIVGTSLPKIRIGNTVTTNALYANSMSSVNARTSPISGYISNINTSGKWRNPIELTNVKGGYHIGFTRREDIQ